MSEESFDQTPLFNFKHLEFFGLSITNKCNEWDKYLEEFLLFRFSYFRVFFVEGNVETLAYFLNLMEGNFLVLKCDLICQSIVNMKRIISSEKDNVTKLKELVPDYLHVVNLSRIVIIQLIQTLFNYKFKLNQDNIQKFMKHDSDLDTREDISVREKIIKYGYVKSRLPTDGSKIGKF